MKTRKPHVTEVLRLLEDALKRATALRSSTPNPEFCATLLEGGVDLIRAKRFIQNLDDWGVL